MEDIARRLLGLLWGHVRGPLEPDVGVGCAVGKLICNVT